MLIKLLKYIPKGLLITAFITAHWIAFDGLITLNKQATEIRHLTEANRLHLENIAAIDASYAHEIRKLRKETKAFKARTQRAITKCNNLEAFVKQCTRAVCEPYNGEVK